MAALLLWSLLVSGAALAQGRDQAPPVHVLMINGGANPQSNFLSHLHHLQDMLKVLEARGVPRERVTLFSADGEDPAPDTAARAPLPEVKNLWLAQGTWLAQLMLPQTELENTTWSGVKLHKASYAGLRQWFKDQRKVMKPGETLMIFVTDHGTRGKDDLDNGNIALWEESMSVLELRALLGHIKPENPVVMVMSQCFSGTFANAMYRLGDPLPQGNACGYFATRRDRYAYGCYPEGRGREKLGHAFQFIDALEHGATLRDAHEHVLTHDDTPDVPTRTSDLFLKARLEREAKTQGVELEAWADELLARAWGEGTAWDREVLLMEQLSQYAGLPMTRSLTGLSRELTEISDLAQRAEDSADLWKDTYKDLKQAHLNRYLGSPQGQSWRKKLQKKRIDGLSQSQRTQELGAFLKDWRAWLEAQGHWERLRGVRGRANRTASVRYNLQKREAAAMRMQSLLLRIAGLRSLEKAQRQSAKPDPDGDALDKLQRCEALALGAPPVPQTSKPPRPLPALDSDLEVLRQAQPSWLGISYKALKKDEARAYGKDAGVILVRDVGEGSPAQAAGLKAGDLILGSGKLTFSEQQPIREWVMTSPQDQALPLRVLRGDKTLELSIRLTAHPLRGKLDHVVLKVGGPAPPLGEVTWLGEAAPQLQGKEHALFFWASWCKECQQALPGLLAWSQQRGVPLVLISDEPSSAQRQALANWEGPRPRWMALDIQRELFRAYGVSKPPGFFHVGTDGKLLSRQAPRLP